MGTSFSMSYIQTQNDKRGRGGWEVDIGLGQRGRTEGEEREGERQEGDMEQAMGEKMKEE